MRLFSRSLQLKKILIYNKNVALSDAKTYTSKTIKEIDKVLIANRGEIACRIMRTAKRLGIKTVAVFSDADKNSLHVEMADEAYHIGPSASSQSYLRQDKIIEVAKNSQSCAIHPGYGFLSENVEFAQNCEKNDVVFIGPPATAIRDMGIKSTSKEIMSNAGVPIIQGYHGEDQSTDTLQKEADRIGYPIMIKAVRGGGGKGMRIALTKNEFVEALESAKSEAQKSFGDSIVLLEKFVQEPRHIEVQVFADKYGNTVHLFERDCSVQRRHQKIIEEAPAPGISENLRNSLGSAAVKAAKAVGYVGAGTVEFIVDRKTNEFYFMEMNTRLQVEHPITEMITGTDLVEWQFRTASGYELPLNQNQIKLNGSAFEARIYAENPDEEFMPGAGLLSYLVPPSGGDDVRIETGVRQGDEVSVFYDPMIAKLVVWDRDRTLALKKLHSKLLEFHIAGLETNVNFLLDLSKHKHFIAGEVHTNFIRDHKESLFLRKNLGDDLKIQGVLAAILFEKDVYVKMAEDNQDGKNPFIVEADFRVNYQHEKVIKFKYKDEDIQATIKFLGNDNYKISLDEGTTWIHTTASLKNNKITRLINEKLTTYSAFKKDNVLTIFEKSGKTDFHLPNPTYDSDENVSLDNLDKAVSPMPGIIDKLLVKKGDSVKKGDPLFVLIAMKMEHTVKASRDALIGNVFFKSGDNVAKDACSCIHIEHQSLSP